MISRLALNQELHAPSDKPSITENMDGLVELDELSEADVKHERCPICKNQPLEKQEGFKICPRCQTMFKMLDGQGYIVGDDKQKPFNIQDYRNKGGYPIMSNRIITRMLKLAEAVAPLQEEQATTGNAYVDAFNRVPKEKLKSIVDKAVDNYITDEYWIKECADSYGNFESVDAEAMINEILEYALEYALDDVLALDEFNKLEEITNYDSVPAEINEAIKEEIRDGGTKQGWSDFEEKLADLMEDDTESEEEYRDPWRGTGMSEKDFL